MSGGDKKDPFSVFEGGTRRSLFLCLREGQESPSSVSGGWKKRFSFQCPGDEQEGFLFLCSREGQESPRVLCYREGQEGRLFLFSREELEDWFLFPFNCSCPSN